MIHLDTSFLIHALVPSSRADKRLRKWLRDGDDLAISAVAWAEFLCGPVGTTEVDIVSAMLQEITPYTGADPRRPLGSSTWGDAGGEPLPTA
ncbi:MAG: PIN domain-containing protein [Candidatus Binatia bacterium]